MIVGDEGAKTLGRLLKSVLVRTGGPLVDEIIICWNGKDEDALIKAFTHEVVERCATTGSPSQFLGWRVGGPTPITIVPQVWPGRFDIARNESFAHAKGEWIIWLDADDEVADAGTPKGLKAIQDCERDYGVMVDEETNNGASVTLKDWLAALPWEANAVLAPYNYVEDADGNCLIRQKMKRIVRRAANFIWWSPENSGVHEVLYPMGGVGEHAVETLGVLPRHYPTNVAEHTKRNMEMVKALAPTNGPDYVDDRYAYDLTNVNIVLGDLKAADESICRAIAHSDHDPTSLYRYRLARASIQFQMGVTNKALGECLAAIGVMPERQEAYFAAAEAFYMQGKWDAVISYVEQGNAKTPQLTSLDQPMARWVSPRSQAAMAYYKRGEPEKGLHLVEEALKRYPKDTLAQSIRSKLLAAANKTRAIRGVLDAAEVLCEEHDSFRAVQLLNIAGESYGLRGVEASPRFKALVARAESMAHEETPRMVEDPEVKGQLWLKRGDAATVRSMATHDDFIVESAEERHDGLRVKTRKRTGKRIAFFCPHGTGFWKPGDIETKGLGGSESSVAHLAVALSKRGHKVTTYTAQDQEFGWYKGIDQRSATAHMVTEQKNHDILISCRAPWIVRTPGLKIPVFCWHQDNGYGNAWQWGPEVEAKLTGNLHVSKWARDGLMREAFTVEPKGHHVIGNGISSDTIEWMKNVPPPDRVRNPLRVVYASDPLRGLSQLVDLWPEVLKIHPKAELHTFCGWTVTIALAQSRPGAPNYTEMHNIQRKLAASPNTTNHDWQSQPVLLNFLATCNVYAYPGGPMPEGYGVSMVQAQASGCEVICKAEGALPEVLGEYATIATTSDEFIRAIGKSMMLPRAEEFRREGSKWTYDNHSWDVVADRFEKAVLR